MTDEELMQLFASQLDFILPNYFYFAVGIILFMIFFYVIRGMIRSYNDWIGLSATDSSDDEEVEKAPCKRCNKLIEEDDAELFECEECGDLYCNDCVIQFENAENIFCKDCFDEAYPREKIIETIIKEQPTAVISHTELPTATSLPEPTPIGETKK